MKTKLFFIMCLLFFAINCFAEELEFIDFNKDLQCIHITNTSKNKQFIIKTYGEYSKLLQFKSKRSYCQNFKLPYIDFEKQTLLGSFTGTGGCSVNHVRKIIRNTTEKKYVYTVTTYSKGLCEIFEENMNWVLIPKVSNEYSIEFEYKHLKAR